MKMTIHYIIQHCIVLKRASNSLWRWCIMFCAQEMKEKCGLWYFYKSVLWVAAGHVFVWCEGSLCWVLETHKLYYHKMRGGSLDIVKISIGNIRTWSAENIANTKIISMGRLLHKSAVDLRK